MKYNLLTDEQRALVVDGRIRQTEGDHYNLVLQLGQVEASGNDENVAKELKDRIKTVEQQLEYLREEATKLPEPNQAGLNPSVPLPPSVRP